MPRDATRERILDTAERHFALYGFAGTSLRGITRDARVNVAAIHYHYGSKEKLLSATMERIVAPVNAQRLRLARRGHRRGRRHPERRGDPERVPVS